MRMPNRTEPYYRPYLDFEIERMLDGAHEILSQGIVTKLTIELIKKDGRGEYHTAALYLHLGRNGNLSASCHDGYRDRTATKISLDEVRTRFTNKVYRKPK